MRTGSHYSLVVGWSWVGLGFLRVFWWYLTLSKWVPRFGRLLIGGRGNLVLANLILNWSWSLIQSRLILSFWTMNGRRLGVRDGLWVLQGGFGWFPGFW